MKSLAEQSVRELGGARSVLARQKRDHIKLDALLDRLASLPAARQRPVLRRIYRLVFPHAFAEESVLWPVLRRVLHDGRRLTLKVEREHQRINELVEQLDSLDPNAAKRRAVLDEVIALLRQDVRDEEDVLLSRLQEQLTPRQLRRLGALWGAVRRISPTRAHPIVSRRPPGNVLAALPLSVTDRLRDWADTVASRGDGPAVGAARILDASMARASSTIERMPGARLGEEAATRVRGARRVNWAVVTGLVTLVAGAAMMARRRQAATF